MRLSGSQFAPMLLCLALPAALYAAAPDSLPAPLAVPPALVTTARAVDFAGTWSGTLVHNGETQAVALELSESSGDSVSIALSLPVVHFDRVPIGHVPIVLHADSIRLGPFDFAYDSVAGTLEGVMPRDLVPAYDIPMRLARRGRFTAPSRPPLAGAVAQPAWSYDARSPIWAGPTFAGGRLYFGTQEGTVYALDARNGFLKWSKHIAGAIRTRPVVTGGAIYFQADDGFLYKLSATDGSIRWRVHIVRHRIVRLPFDDPGSRFDRFGSDVTVAGDRLVLGTHEGQVLAIDPANGRRVWEFTAGDAVLAAPAVVDGNVVFGSFDGFVYCLDAANGALRWKHDTRGAVVSTPAIAGNRVVVGNRSYDLLGLDLATGEVAWRKYVWSSWIESSATLVDGTAYIGSSDAAAVFAYDAQGGDRRWATDVHGWTWGQPAFASDRVYVGISGQVGYPVPHEGGVIALDRRTGAIVWRSIMAPGAQGPFGVPGSPSTGDGRVYVGGLDGRILAFLQ